MAEAQAAHGEGIKVGLLTSGGDAPGMNAIIRAVVRTTLQLGATPYAIHEGWRGAVEGGDLIRALEWGDVSGILSQGGTAIGTARSDEFRERSGIKKAVLNFIERGIDRLVVIGGDGTLSGADELRELWPELIAELVSEGAITQDDADTHAKLRLAGVVGSIDNDLVGTDMTVGTDSALHRIVDAIDAIASTAASHQRTFIIEVMGRRCGYLALMSAIAGGCDYVFIPELPPEDGWEDAMAEKLRVGRENGRRDSLIIVAEGAQDRAGNAITSDLVQKVVQEKLGEEARITALGHVQRGGSPSAYDRWMPTLLGYTAAWDMVHAGPETEPIIVGTRGGKIIRLPMMEAIQNTRKVKEYFANRDWDAAVEARGKGYREMINTFEILSAPLQRTDVLREDAPRVGIIHAGGLAPGMNPAARAAVKLGLNAGLNMVGIEGGFPGLLKGRIREMQWADVEGWAEDGGAVLGTRRTTPTIDQYYQFSRAIEDAKLDALLIIGGFDGYNLAYQMVNERDRYPAFNIPIVVVPASIDNNLPGADFSIGTDTALNNNTAVMDRIKQSASASKRCFVVETMGRKCGYLALMSGMTSGAEQVYLYEDGITLAQLAKDTDRIIKAFEAGRRLYLVVRNEEASEYYTTDFLQRIFEEEGENLFDVRSAILGHAQQGGNPSPFDRTLAVRAVNAAVKQLQAELEGKNDGAFHIGCVDGHQQPIKLSHMNEIMDMENRLPRVQWWHGLKDVIYAVSDPETDLDFDVLPLILE